MKWLKNFAINLLVLILRSVKYLPFLLVLLLSFLEPVDKSLPIDIKIGIFFLCFIVTGSLTAVLECIVEDDVKPFVLKNYGIQI